MQVSGGVCVGVGGGGGGRGVGYLLYRVDQLKLHINGTFLRLVWRKYVQ